MLGWFRRRRRDRIRSEPFPPEWRELLQGRVPYWGRLGPEDRNELEGAVAIFLDEKAFEGCAGLEITDEMRVTIAGGACVLLLHRDTDFYPYLQVIRVYPAAYVVPARRREGLLVVEGDEVRAGESWQHGAVILAWDQVIGGNATDGRNVVFHEFAHQLDAEDGPVDGAPALGDRARYAAWAKVLGDEYEALKQALEARQHELIRPYGATSPPEFFAVISELFFERPRDLEREHPALYARLRDFYRQDPARL